MWSKRVKICYISPRRRLLSSSIIFSQYVFQCCLYMPLRESSSNIINLRFFNGMCEWVNTDEVVLFVPEELWCKTFFSSFLTTSFSDLTFTELSFLLLFSLTWLLFALIEATFSSTTLLSSWTTKLPDSSIFFDSFFYSFSSSIIRTELWDFYLF